MSVYAFKAESNIVWKIRNEWKLALPSNVEKKVFLKRKDDKQTFKLPDANEYFCEAPWKIDSLMALKTRLNQEKDRLNEIDLDAWRKHTNAMNPSRQILPIVRNNYGPEFATKAWGKIMEFMWSEKIIEATVESQNDTFNTVHLCEGPGGFVSGINHYIHTNYPGVKWNWLATTLNPYHESSEMMRALDDDTIIRASHRHWTYLADNTGDIINEENIKYLAREAGIAFPFINLVTADGSVDCQVVPNEQENTVSSLVFAEIISAIHILGKGGSFILKIFTIFECQTVCYLYFLSCLFAEVKLAKPVLSKEGNSEVYVLCHGYYGYPLELKDVPLYSDEKLRSVLFNALIPLNQIPESFVDKIKKAAEFFTTRQMSALSRNFTSFGHVAIYQKLNCLSREFAYQWITDCEIKNLQPEFRMFNGPEELAKLAVRRTLSSQECTKLTPGALDKKVKIILDDIGKYFNVNRQRTGFIIKEPFRIECLTYGKLYGNVMGSKFCCGRMLKLRQELRELASSNYTSYLEDLETEHCTTLANKAKLDTTVSKFQEAGTGWNMVTLCFHENLNILSKKTDAEITKTRITELIDFITKLNMHYSVFLCEYPLLTRLHIGIIFALTGVFEKVSIGYNRHKKLHGVLLFDFRGFQSQPNLIKDLVTVVNSLEGSIPNQAILECISVETICASKYAADITQYNLENLYRGLQQCADLMSDLVKL